MIWAWIKNILSSDPQGHQGPLAASDPDWKGSKYNVQVEWETGEITYEPLSIIAALMTQLPVQHMPKRMIYLLLKDGIGSETLPRKIKTLQGQSSKVRSDKSQDPKLTCLGS